METYNIPQLEKDICLIQDAINAYWNEANYNLTERNNLGDLEKIIYEKQKENTKRLLTDIDNNNHAIASLPSLLKEIEELKGLQKNAGFDKIELEHQYKLVSSCENALYESNQRNEELKAINGELVEALRTITSSYEAKRKSDLIARGHQYMEDSQTITSKKLIAKSTNGLPG